MTSTIDKLGAELLYDPLLNRGTAFTAAERDKHGLHGMLPPREETLEQPVSYTHLTLPTIYPV